MNTQTFTNADQTARAAADHIEELLVLNVDRSILLQCSGGSALEILTYLHADLVGDNLTLTVLDERYTFEQQHQNYHALQNTTFFEEAVSRGAHTIDPTPIDGEVYTKTAERFEEALKTWKQHNPNGLVIATIGVGADGHTAGIMPDPDEEEMFEALFLNKEQWIVGYETKGRGEYDYRITPNVYYLTTRIDHTIVYAVGENKQAVLDQLQHTNQKIPTVPAILITHIPNSVLFTDLDVS